MKHNYSAKPLLYLLMVYLSLGILDVSGQVKKNFEPRYQDNIRGEITFIANNIVNRDEGSGERPNDPYNETGWSSEYNDDLNMQYIDIDGDNSTFSSSSAILTVPDPSCSKVRYAGLYWGAVFKESDRSGFNQVKFKTPGGSYQSLTADEILFDGDGDSDFGDYAPYACYKDVTPIITSMNNPNGEYFVADVRAGSGDAVTGGVSGGWTLVIVYENPNLPGKYITTFDGYAGIKSGETQEFSVNGFTTLPDGFPVRAKIGVATLEGDNRITGDELSIRANSNASFTSLGNAVNPSNNFFNSNITIEENIITSRNPNSINTLGWDTDMFSVNNPSNSVIPNNETGAILKASSTQDKYDIFFTSFDVEIIEPEIQLQKNVQNEAGLDIEGQDVHFGDLIDYILTFQNIGNDNAQNYTIRDVLPTNVVFQSVEIPSTLQGLISYTYDPATREVVFTVDNSLVEIGSAKYSVRIKVKVVENCSELRDACSNLIENLAYSTYRGELNDNQITDDPSFSEFESCGFPTPGSTNFLVDIDDCKYSNNAFLCGPGTELDAGAGFDTYQWQKDNGSGTYVDIPGANSATYTATTTGNYKVIKTNNDGTCLGFDEFFNVQLFTSGIENPLIPYADVMETCPDDGSDLAKIFICGPGQADAINTNIAGAKSIKWEQLDAACETLDTDDLCPTKDNTCRWNQVGTGANFTPQDAGEYRLVAEFDGGCIERFYFNVYTNPVQPEFVKEDILCSTPGEIRVTNIPEGYEFQLVDDSGSVIESWSTNRVFSITTAGIYKVEVRQPGITQGCIFTTEPIGIREVSLSDDGAVVVAVEDVLCNDPGKIRVQINTEVGPNYYFNLYDENGVLIDDHVDSTYKEHTFEVAPGTYRVEVLAGDSSNTACNFTTSAVVAPSDFQIAIDQSQDISCSEGNIQMQNGNDAKFYAIWSYVPDGDATAPPISYNDPSEIPATEWQTSVIFDVPIDASGEYVIIAESKRGCYAYAGPINIDLIPPVSYKVDHKDILCYGDDNGEISIEIIGSKGPTYILDYKLVHPDGTITESQNDKTIKEIFLRDLPPGDYILTVILRHGNLECPKVHTITIDEPDAALTGEYELTADSGCDVNNQYSGGTVTAINVSGGTPFVDANGTPYYTYSKDGVDFTNTTGIFEDLDPDTYTLYIRDANDCTVTDQITISDFNPPTNLDFNATPITCVPANSTSDVTVLITGGEPPFTVEIISPSNIPASSVSGNRAIFNDLTPNTYVFKVTDSKGCTYEEPFIIEDVQKIDVSGSVVSHVSCSGAQDGSISFTVQNFNGTYSYTVATTAVTTIPPGNGVNTTPLVFNNLAGGEYTITVTDDSTQCTDSFTLTIDEPEELVAGGAVSIQPTCLVGATITASAGGGTAPYQYQLVNLATGNPVPGYNFAANRGNTVFTDIAPGNYEIQVRDANNCLDSFPVNVATPDPVNVNVDSVTECYQNDSNGSITITVSGGDGNYEVSRDGGTTFIPITGNTHTFTGLTAGNYDIVVKDGKGCESPAGVTVDIADQISAVAELTTPLDCSSTGGVITVTIDGGTPDYTYLVNINNAGYTGTPVNIGAGPAFTYPVTNVSTTTTYQFQITDSQNCVTETGVITVEPITTLDASHTATPVSCNGNNDGIVEIVVDNTTGTPPYTINFNGNGDSSETIYSGLAAGTYPYTVTDANGCEYTDSAVVNEPAPILATLSNTNVTCNSDGSGETPGSVTVTITSGGTSDFTYTLYDSTHKLLDEVTTANTTHKFDGIGFGFYYVQIVDANGCAAEEGSINVLAEPFLQLDGVIDAVNCATGATVTLLASTGSGDYNFEIYGSSPPITPDNEYPGTSVDEEYAVFTGLTPGLTYIFKATDNATGCTSYVSQYIDSPSTMIIDITSVEDIDCFGNNNGSIIFTADNFDGATDEISYTILNRHTNDPLTGAGTYSGIEPTPISASGITINDIPPGDYLLQVEENGNQCAQVAEFRILEPTPVDISLIAQTNANCNIGAQVTVRGSGGTGPYEYAFVPASGGTPSYNTVASVILDHTITTSWIAYVRDANGCEDMIPIDIIVDDEPTVTVTSPPNQCNTSGTYTFTVNGTGVGPLMYSIDGVNFQTSTSFTVSQPGTYTVTVRDANGCTATTTTDVIIYPPLQFNHDIVKLLDCELNNENAQIEIEIIGGSSATISNITYDVTGPAGFTPITGRAFSTNPEIFNWANVAGDYTITIYDSVTGCSVSKTINVPEKEVPEISDDSIAKTDVTCYGGNDGTISVTVDNLNLGPFDFILTAPDGSTQTQTGNSTLFTGLIAGNYTVTATSTVNDCPTSSAKQITITEPTQVSIPQLTVDQFACQPGTNNSTLATVTAGGVTGGNVDPAGDYIYEFVYDNGTPGNTNDDITQRSRSTEFIVNNIAGGTVTVVAYDDNGCSSAPAMETIDPFVPLDEVIAAGQDLTCNGNDGNIVVTVNGGASIGSAQLTYELTLQDGTPVVSFTGNTSTHTFTGLDQIGFYMVTVTNEADCQLQAVAELENPNTFDVEVNKIQDVTCYGTETGIVDVQLIDPTYSGNYTWVIYNATDNTPVKSGNNGGNTGITLVAGLYYVEITQTEAPFCTNRKDFAIMQSLNPLEIDPHISADITCETTTGEITANATGGWGNYEYAVVPQGNTPASGDFSTNNVFTGLNPGAYDVYVRDDSGCASTFETVELLQLNPITADVTHGSNILCYGDYSGIINIFNVRGGRPEVDPDASYLYILNMVDDAGNIIRSLDSNLDPTFDFLPEGRYSITVTDGYACDYTSAPILITGPAEIEVSLVKTQRLTCAGNNAEVEIRVDGGTAPYAYATTATGTFIPFSGNTITISGLDEGEYSYYIQDANGCISQVSNAITIEPVPELKLSAELTTDVDCFGHATGYVKLKATGGLGRYRYSLYNSSDDQLVAPQTENYFDGLKAGNYYVIVDSEDCQARTDIQINDGNELRLKTPVVQNPLCVDGFGAINVGLEGGTGVYKYAISPQLDQFFDEGDFTDLLPGDYTIIAQDSKGCEPFVLDFRIQAPDPLVMATQTVVHESCFGENDGYIEINVSGGTAPYYTSLNSQDDNDFVQDQFIFSNLEGGKSHIIFVRDANGCEINLVVPIEAGPDLRAEVEVIEECVDNAAQNRVEVILLNQSGITPDDVLYALNSTDINQAVSFDYTDGQKGIIENVAPGADQYITLFYEACAQMIPDDQRFTINQIDPVMLVDTSDPNAMNLVEVSASGGVPPYTYYFNDKNQGSDNTYYVSSTDPGYTDASGAEIKQVTVRVTDALGCSYEVVVEKEFIDIDIPDHFTPNGDNYNDTWGPDNDEGFPEIRTRIYDRYGRMVAEIRIGEKWDGRYKGSPLPTGDYWYVIKLEGSDEREFMGHFTLLR